jgi:hypothetical protein
MRRDSEDFGTPLEALRNCTTPSDCGARTQTQELAKPPWTTFVIPPGNAASARPVAFRGTHHIERVFHGEKIQPTAIRRDRGIRNSTLPNHQQRGTDLRPLGGRQHPPRLRGRPYR